MIRKGVARGEWMTVYIKWEDNEADLLTKQLPDGEKRKGFVNNFIYNIYRTRVD